MGRPLDTDTLQSPSKHYILLWARLLILTREGRHILISRPLQSKECGKERMQGAVKISLNIAKYTVSLGWKTPIGEIFWSSIKNKLTGTGHISWQNCKYVLIFLQYDTSRRKIKSPFLDITDDGQHGPVSVKHGDQETQPWTEGETLS